MLLLLLLLLLLLDSLNAVIICFLGTWGFCKSKSRVIWGRDWANNPESKKHREIPASSYGESSKDQSNDPTNQMKLNTNLNPILQFWNGK